jgi:hypothetical protein
MTDGGAFRLVWPAWLDRWDAQQTGYIPEREARFAVMFDVLDVLLPPDFVAVNLACGPGLCRSACSIDSRGRAASRWTWIPVLLAMGQHVYGALGGRLRWGRRLPAWRRLAPVAC